MDARSMRCTEGPNTWWMPFIYALDWEKALNQGKKTERHTCMSSERQEQNQHQTWKCCVLHLDCSVLFKKNVSYKTLTINLKYCTRASSFTVFLWATCQCEWAVIADGGIKPLIIWWHCCEWRQKPQNCKKRCPFFFSIESFVNSVLLQMWFILVRHSLKGFVRQSVLRLSWFPPHGTVYSVNPITVFSGSV